MKICMAPVPDDLCERKSVDTRIMATTPSPNHLKLLIVVLRIPQRSIPRLEGQFPHRDSGDRHYRTPNGLAYY